MVIEKFPPVEEAQPDGLLAVGGDLEVPSLLAAYKSGIFPWPPDDDILLWFAPPKRALIFLSDFHISKSTAKHLRRAEYSFAINENFSAVIEECRRGQTRPELGTWITPSMILAYKEMHRQGHCHSIECYYKKELVGGVYGVAIGGYFAAESMFYLQSNASKLALHHLVQYLAAKDVKWFDCQVINPFLASIGATEVPRKNFMSLLSEALTKNLTLFS
jgi:leucyl/phenylalanyl-tRNA--protein transferase